MNYGYINKKTLAEMVVYKSYDRKFLDKKDKVVIDSMIKRCAKMYSREELINKLKKY